MLDGVKAVMKARVGPQSCIGKACIGALVPTTVSAA
jgi:hypothetical protein